MFLRRRGKKSFRDTVVNSYVGLTAYYAAYPLKTSLISCSKASQLLCNKHARKAFMFDVSESLGEDVSGLMIRRDVFDSDLVVMNVMSNSMVAYIDMFGLTIFGRILRDLKCSWAICQERYRSQRRGKYLQFTEELFSCQSFACSVGEGHIFRFRAREGNSVLLVS